LVDADGTAASGTPFQKMQAQYSQSNYPPTINAISTTPAANMFYHLMLDITINDKVCIANPGTCKTLKVSTSVYAVVGNNVDCATCYANYYLIASATPNQLVDGG
jgi:hypothetical protein